VIRGDRIAELGQHSRAGNRAYPRRLQSDAIEEGRVLHVGRILVPGVALTQRHRQSTPALVTVEDIGVLRVKHLRFYGAENFVFYFLG
jgi:hypothetical protein